MPFEPQIPREIHDKAKELFESSKLSCREIAEQLTTSTLTIKGPTVQTWANREGWIRPGVAPAIGLQRKAKVQLERKVESLVERKAIALTERATAFKEKAIATSEKWMNTLDSLCDQLSASSALDPELIQKAVSAHKMMVDTGFKIHGLDDQKQVLSLQLNCHVVEIRPDAEPIQPAIDVETVEPNVGPEVTS